MGIFVRSPTPYWIIRQLTQPSLLQLLSYVPGWLCTGPNDIHVMSWCSSEHIDLRHNITIGGLMVLSMLHYAMKYLSKCYLCVLFCNLTVNCACEEKHHIVRPLWELSCLMSSLFPGCYSWSVTCLLTMYLSLFPGCYSWSVTCLLTLYLYLFPGSYSWSVSCLLTMYLSLFPGCYSWSVTCLLTLYLSLFPGCYNCPVTCLLTMYLSPSGPNDVGSTLI